MKLKFPVVVIFGIGIAAIAFSLSGCGKKQEELPTDPIALAQDDMQKMGSIDPAGPKAMDESSSGAFTKIFGGTTGTDVLHYMNERVHYFITNDSPMDFYPRTFTHKSWASDNVTADSDIVIAASNFGGELWFQGLLDGVTFRYSYKNEKDVPVTSPRVGIIRMGEGYLKKMTKSKLMPSVSRQGILLHEARHSDCTGGLNQDALEAGRKAPSYKKFIDGFPRRACLHLHTLCPSGHTYENLAACDSEAWGSYAVEAIYLTAMIKNMPSDEIETNVMRMDALDRYTRLQFNVQEMFDGKLGAPDMSSVTEVK